MLPPATRACPQKRLIAQPEQKNPLPAPPAFVPDMTVGVRVVVIVIHVLGWFSVVTPNGTVASTAFGWVDVNKSARATPANVVPAGSLAKPFTAALVMQQVEQGRMALDDNLAPYVDQYLATWRRHKSGPATTLVSLYGPRMANVTPGTVCRCGP